MKKEDYEKAYGMDEGCSFWYQERKAFCMDCYNKVMLKLQSPAVKVGKKVPPSGTRRK